MEVVITMDLDEAKGLEIALEAARQSKVLWSDKVHAIDVGLSALRDAIKESEKSKGGL